MKYKLKKKHIVAITAVAYIVLTAFLSRGDPFYVESDEPLEDIVAICHWSSSAFPGLHGGTHHVTRKKGVVLKSGEIASCGMNWFAGLTLSFKTYDTLKHPTHEFFFDRERDDGVTLVRTKIKLELLDEQKAKFEAGYWDNYMNPGAEYSRNLAGCGFGYKYLEYYKNVKELNVGYFKNLYHKPMLECISRTFSILKKYQPRASKNFSSAEIWMDKMWESDSWKK
ncbi:MAG: hypothetical protein KAJ92_06430 [Gammaproteobacteria bacterium]|nr:hypothetical protein [Gammaproteobacteria bacterium]MCK5263304.1 hypothetical protein [Gammaproteobacteria bacterium]